MIDGIFNARGHIVNDGLDDYGTPLIHIQEEAYRKRLMEEKRMKDCVSMYGGHFLKETTSTYPRCFSDGTPTTDGWFHHFECPCGYKKTIQDIHLSQTSHGL